MDFQNSARHPGARRKSNALENRILVEGMSQVSASNRSPHAGSESHESDFVQPSFTLRESHLPISLPPLPESYINPRGVTDSAAQHNHFPPPTRRRARAPSLNTPRPYTPPSPRTRSDRTSSSNSARTGEDERRNRTSTLSSRADHAFQDALRASVQQSELASSTDRNVGSAVLPNSSTVPRLTMPPQVGAQARARHATPRPVLLTMHRHHDEDSEDEFDVWLHRLCTEAAQPTDARIAEMYKMAHAATNLYRAEFGGANVKDQEREAMEKPLKEWRCKVTKSLLVSQQVSELDGSTDCQMCFESYGVETPEGVCEVAVKLPCNHVFGHQCMRRWLSEAKHMECPYCRSRLVPSLDVHGHSIAKAWLRSMMQYLREIQDVRRKLWNRREDAEERLSQQVANVALRARRARQASLDEDGGDEGRPSSRRRINLSGQAASVHRREARPAPPQTAPGQAQQRSVTGPDHVAAQNQNSQPRHSPRSSRSSRRSQGRTAQEDNSALPGEGFGRTSTELHSQPARNHVHAFVPLADDHVAGRGTLPGIGYLGASAAAIAPGAPYVANLDPGQQSLAAFPHADIYVPPGMSYESYIRHTGVFSTDPSSVPMDTGWRLPSVTGYDYYYAVQALDESFNYDSLGMPQHSRSSNASRTRGEDLVNPS